MVSLTFAEQSGMMRQPGRIKFVEILREQGPKSGELLMHHDDTVAMLREVAAGKRPATLRIYQPNPTVAFGRRDELNPGFTAAAQACRDDQSLIVVSHGSAIARGIVSLMGLDPAVFNGLRGVDNCHWSELVPVGMSTSKSAAVSGWRLASHNIGSREDILGA